MKTLVYVLAASLGFLALLLLWLAGPSYRSGTFELGTAFALLRYAAYAGIAAVVVAIACLAWVRPAGMKLALVLVSAVLGLAAFYLPYRQMQMAGQVPPIHDITTDTRNPPAFVAVVPLRADAPNPVTYEGETVAAQQRAAYPDLSTVTLSSTVDDVFEAALAEIDAQGWELVEASRPDGRIEATATTRWFGFKDDVVLRLAPAPTGGTLLDLRSKSRVGRSDIGTNAARIRTFVSALRETVQ